MKKTAILFILPIFMLALIFPLTVNADTGPKPSVQITFKNMGDELCYGTLLSEHGSTGPASVWDGDKEHIYDNGLDIEIWQAFVDYIDADGFYFLQWAWKCSETKSLKWGYYPPSPFKILLYYPDTETFVVSEICQRYAFDSYFTVDMNGVNIGLIGEIPTLSAEKSYDYTLEIVSLVCRTVITILLEIGIALLFGLRLKKQLLLIGGVNIITQISLNVALNLINYYQGVSSYLLNYLLFEFIVFLVEAVIYALFLNKFSDRHISTRMVAVYALVANSASFAAGIVIAKLIPGIF